MGVKTEDEKTLRKYLLGQLSPEEQEKIELWLLSEEDAYDLIEAAEDDLVDEFLGGKLSGQALERFNNHFLTAADRQRKLQFGRSFQRFIAANTSTMAHGLPAQKTLFFWSALGGLVLRRPAIDYVLCALAVFVFAGGTWSVVRSLKLEQQLHSSTAQLTEVERERDEFRRQLVESRSLTERLQAQFQSLEQAVTTAKSSSPQALLAFNLIPGISRSSNDIPKLTANVNVRLVRFSLILLDDNYESYRAGLVDGRGKELWTRDHLNSFATGDGKAVVLTVPGELLSNGDYSFSLSGLSDSHPPENVSSFYFRVVRQ